MCVTLKHSFEATSFMLILTIIKLGTLLFGKLLRILQKVYYLNMKKCKEKVNKVSINMGAKMCH